MKLALSMLVWNEAHVVGRAIDSVKEYLDYYCIVLDSRTTDNSEEVILRHMGDIPGEIIKREFDGFDTQRNAALEPLKEKTDWVLILDADEVFMAENFDKNELTNDWAYFMPVRAGVSSHNSIRLFNYNKPWYWSGAIHNYLECPGYTTSPVLNDIWINHIHDGHRSKIKNKGKNDIKILKKLVSQYPENERYWFYYAQTLREEGKYKRAIDAYVKRLESNKYPEETWFSMYMIAVCYANLNDFDNMMGWTLRAYDFRPYRAEPLYYASVIARDNELRHIHFMLTRMIVEIKKPKGETLFIEEAIYEWRASFEHAIACYHLGYKERALGLFKKLKTEWYDSMEESYKKQCDQNIDLISEEISPTDPTKTPIYFNPGMSTFGLNYMNNYNFRRVPLDKADVDGLLWFGIYSDEEYNAVINTSKNINLHWCGSDVLWCKTDRVRIDLLAKKLNINHTCENELQQTELKEEGISADIAPMFSESIDSFSISNRDDHTLYDVLVYTPRRHELYNVALMIDVAADLPDLKFAFIGDDLGILEYLPDNVSNLGWVSQDQVKELILKSRVYLRITEHDAFPDLTIKSLLSGTRVVTNWDYFGCDVVEKSKDDIVTTIKDVINEPLPEKVCTFYRESGFLNDWKKILKYDYRPV